MRFISIYQIKKKTEYFLKFCLYLYIPLKTCIVYNLSFYIKPVLIFVKQLHPICP